jgi:hypothetical protein
VSQEACARLREGVPCGKVYRYNPKHLCPNLNGYGDNGQRKVWSSVGSTHCNYQLTSLINVCPWVWCGVTSALASHESCIVFETLRTKMICVPVLLYFNLMAYVTHKLVWCYVHVLTLQKPHIPASFNMYSVINKCVTAVKVLNFSCHYLRNRSTLDIGLLGYIGILYHKEHPPEVWHIPPGTPCIYIYIYIFVSLSVKKYNKLISC